MLRLGDTIRLKGHVCIVASDPAKNPNQVFLVAFTTFEDYKDDTCFVRPGEHPRIHHDTCVAYNFFNDPLFPVEKLECHERCEPVSHDLLDRILAGAGDTIHINTAAWRLMDDQGLI